MSLPERLGRLRRIDRIGAGGFATVWLYHDDELDSPVAVKALADNWSQREDVCDRFLEEARILRRADSDHVVRVYDIGAVDGTPYFVMSYADRGSVADLIEPGRPLPAERVVDLLAQAGDGIAVLHRHGVIHRDVKPQNLLRRSTPEGGERVMVADLGVAKAMLHASGLTQVVGTPAYMAPEQAVGIGLDLRADVHALGAVGYHLLTGRLVRDGGFGALAVPALPPPPSEVVGSPAPYDDVLLRALATDPGDRWPDVPSFVAALRQAEQAAGTPSAVTVQAGDEPQVRRVAASASEPRIETLSDNRRGNGLRLAGLVLLVLLLAFGASYGATRVLGGDPDGGDPSGKGTSPTDSAGLPSGDPAPDIDYPPLTLPASFDTHEVRAGQRVWSYAVPAGWVPFRAGDPTGDDRIPMGKVDQQTQVRWRPQGEPAVGGYSLRAEALSTTETVAQQVAAKAAAVAGLSAGDVYEQTDDTVYFTYRDGSNRLRYNFFRWVANDAGEAALEISVTGRKADEAALSELLDRVSRDAAQS
ncbi:MAG: serine/threonine-protein kinase [Propionibacteriales bacterium]|nr:serine/threonine-protein kinase [Propionibacteriales bacterium]